MHPRRHIREAFKARLIGGNTLAGPRVYATMTPKINLESVLSEQGPVIMAYVRSETIRTEDYPVSGFDGYVKRTLDICIEALAMGGDADNNADDLAEQIEALFDDFVVPDMENTTIKLIETQIDVTDAFERILGGVFMTYEVTYWTKYREDTSDPWEPCEVYGIANGEHGDPPGYADPVLGVTNPTIQQAKELGWQPGDLLVDDCLDD